MKIEKLEVYVLEDQRGAQEIVRVKDNVGSNLYFYGKTSNMYIHTVYFNKGFYKFRYLV